jgi:hypothetical protein
LEIKNIVPEFYGLRFEDSTQCKTFQDAFTVIQQNGVILKSFGNNTIFNLSNSSEIQIPNSISRPSAPTIEKRNQLKKEDSIIPFFGKKGKALPSPVIIVVLE